MKVKKKNMKCTLTEINAKLIRKLIVQFPGKNVSVEGKERRSKYTTSKCFYVI